MKTILDKIINNTLFYKILASIGVLFIFMNFSTAGWVMVIWGLIGDVLNGIEIHKHYQAEHAYHSNELNIKMLKGSSVCIKKD